MRLLIVGINYAPEQTSVGPFTTVLSEHLVEQGHHVTVITAFPYYPEWRVHEPYQGLRYRRETINGVEVHRVCHFVPSRPRSLVQRLLHDVTFSLGALLAMPLAGDFDVVFCSSPPPFTPLAGWLGGLVRRAPMIVSLTDLSSDAAASLGIMGKFGWLARLARAIEGFGYGRATAISVLCPAFKENLLRRGVPADKITINPLWVDTSWIRPLPRENGFRSAQGLAGDEFVALYSGNFGLKQGLETAVEAAALTETARKPVTWLLVGDGEERGRLQEKARAHSLARLRFIPLQPAEVFPMALAAADVLLLVQRASVTDIVIPSKMLTYMAAGRPIVAAANGASTTAHYIRDAQCGVVVTPEDPAALADAIEDLRQDPERCQEMGMNGRKYAEQHFSRPSALAQYDNLLQNVLRGGPRAGSD